MEESITIKMSEYLSLKEDEKMLNALRSAGVDNWEGYDYAQELFRENDK